MYFRMFFDEDLAQCSYLIGCPRAREAVVIDPLRDVDRYMEAAEEGGMAIRFAAETHVHADYLSGTRELARAAGAVAVVSAEGGDDWTPGWLDAGGRAVRDGDEFAVGSVSLRVMHTPGHTPEHISFVVAAGDGGASGASANGGGAMGICTGDFVFVGGLGRPDLLEKAAGHAGSMEPAARDLCASVRRFRELPEHLQVWPGHGAGSACGKSMLAVPQSTVGYELRRNPAIGLSKDEGAFVRDILADQPDAPAYFGRMKHLNVIGPALLHGLPRGLPSPAAVGAQEMVRLGESGATVIDTRPWDEFRARHIRGSLHAPLDNMFTTIAGCYVDPDRDVLLVCPDSRVQDAVRRLVHVGIDRVRGHMPPERIADVMKPASIGEVPAGALAERLAGGGVLLDVRRSDEFAAGHVAGASHVPHVQLRTRLGEVPDGDPVYVMCLGGVRSARACALLAGTGRTIVNVAGGYSAWQRAGGPKVKSH